MLPRIILPSPDVLQPSDVPVNVHVNNEPTPASHTGERSSISSNFAGTPRNARLAYLRSRIMGGESARDSQLLFAPSRPERQKSNAHASPYDDFSSASKKVQNPSESKNVPSDKKNSKLESRKEGKSNGRRTLAEDYIFHSRTNKPISKLVQAHMSDTKTCGERLPLLAKLPKPHFKNPYTQSLTKPMLKSYKNRGKKSSNRQVKI